MKNEPEKPAVTGNLARLASVVRTGQLQKLRRRGLSLAVWNCYLDHADAATGEGYPSLKRLSKLTGASRGSILKARQWLLEEHYLELISRGGGAGNPGVYRVTTGETVVPIDTVSERVAVSRTVSNPVKSGAASEKQSRPAKAKGGAQRHPNPSSEPIMEPTSSRELDAAEGRACGAGEAGAAGNELLEQLAQEGVDEPVRSELAKHLLQINRGDLGRAMQILAETRSRMTGARSPGLLVSKLRALTRSDVDRAMTHEQRQAVDAAARSRDRRVNEHLEDAARSWRRERRPLIEDLKTQKDKHILVDWIEQQLQHELDDPQARIPHSATYEAKWELLARYVDRFPSVLSTQLAS